MTDALQKALDEINEGSEKIKSSPMDDIRQVAEEERRNNGQFGVGA